MDGPGRLVLGLAGIYLVLWCASVAVAIPLGELAVSSGFSPEQLLAPGGEALVDAFLHRTRERLSVSGWGRGLAGLAVALVARGALMELGRGTLDAPSGKRAGAYIFAWISGRIAMGLLLGLGWLVVRAADSVSWLEPSLGGRGLVLFTGLVLLALGRALDAWWSFSWAAETDACGQVFGALHKLGTWSGGFLTNGLRLWGCSLGVILGRACLLALFAKLSLVYLGHGKLTELTALSHLTLLLNLGMELGWYAFVSRVQASSAVRARACDPSKSDL